MRPLYTICLPTIHAGEGSEATLAVEMWSHEMSMIMEGLAS